MIIYCSSDVSLINIVFLAHMVSGNVFLVQKICVSFYISAITVLLNKTVLCLIK